MLTYDFQDVEGPLYEYIYKCMKLDILSGVLKPGEKLPSKRSFANNHGISTITIQNAYDQLISEGYVYAVEKKGYYVAKIAGLTKAALPVNISYDIAIPKPVRYEVDLSNNGVHPDSFPFSVWTKVNRNVMANRKDELMCVAPAGGVRALREAIARHLKSFRGMLVDPDQIIVGAGTEYLYGLIAELLGKDKVYVIENPGYRKLVNIYGQRGIVCRYTTIDEYGVTLQGLHDSGAMVAHICPNHHFPTGITMPASRRYEVLSWANESQERYLIEDDYDSEFRADGKPIPTLFSIDGCEKVIYMNTFSKSLSPTIRISYMVLPSHLANRFYATMSFYACTVSNFEQYTLAQFISEGYFEKHINRMRLYYRKQRKLVIETIERSRLKNICEILENDSGLHFLLKLDTTLSDEEITTQLLKNGIKLKALSEYTLEKTDRQHYFIINYSNIEIPKLEHALEIMAAECN